MSRQWIERMSGPPFELPDKEPELTRWVEDTDPTLPEVDGHHWEKPAPADCPNCPCHTARVCERGAQNLAPATYADGTPYNEPCPCARKVKA